MIFKKIENLVNYIKSFLIIFFLALYYFGREKELYIYILITYITLCIASLILSIQSNKKHNILERIDALKKKLYQKA